MRHRKAGRKFGRTSAHRKAMFRNMTTSLLKHGTIKTTLAKAKEVRSYVEPVITLARKHVWANYAQTATALASALTALAPAFESATAEQKQAYSAVTASQAKVQNRFPSGLGALLKALNAMSDVDATLVDTVRTARAAQMDRQHALTLAGQTVVEAAIIEKLFGEIADQFAGRNGGYTRVVKAGSRPGDNAPMAYIALVQEQEVVEAPVAEEAADAE